ncbi:MAG: hypothetical protein ACR2G7_13320 [Acidimicrobiales bacterium]
MARRPIRPASLLVVVLLASACGSAPGDAVLSRSAINQSRTASGPPETIGPDPQTAPEAATSTTVTTATPTTIAPPAPATTTATVPVTAAPEVPATPPAPALPRAVSDQPWTPFATAGDVTLVHPSSRVERVGFHQSNNEGARPLDALSTAVAPATMEGRGRLSDARTAADVVIDPDIEVRSPVTGTVKRAGTYVLYCKYSDDYAVIEPDVHPGWEVKVLHINGVQVGVGDRVVAGETVIAGGPTHLPFESQVDELTTASTPWPHVHIEVIDPAIPDIPNPGGGCD